MKKPVTTKRTGILVEVYRTADGYDCTNGGVSSRFNRFVVIDDAIDGPNEPTAEMPALRIVRRKIGGELYMHLEPVDAGDEWLMFGGNYACTSDSRFCCVAAYPLPIHDRVER